MAFGIIEFLIGITAFFIIVYKCLSWNYDFWKKRGVPGPKPTVPFGNYGDVVFQRRSAPHLLMDLYNEYKSEPFIGYFLGSSPKLLLIDPDLIKSVFIRDFDVFNGRGLAINEDIEPLAAHLVNLDGTRSKDLRHKLTPVFTSSKLKKMFYLIEECCDNLERRLTEQVKNNDTFNVSEEAARYTIDVVGSCVFGINTQALGQEDNMFRNIGSQIFKSSLISQAKRLLRESSPSLYKFLRITIEGPQYLDFFLKTMREAVASRKKTNIVRNDFVDTLIQISEENSPGEVEWNDISLTAQAFLFFAAGFETSSTTTSFCLWELAHCPDAQNKLRQDIHEFEKKNNGKIDYESIKEMKYLDMVVKEVLRKHSPADSVLRATSQEYTIPKTQITLPAGVHVFVSIWAIHNDPDIYPNPNVFDPERFSDKCTQARHPMTFMPFGNGPKSCIGSRFAMYQVKMALIRVIKNFRILPINKTMDKVIEDKTSFLLTPVGGIHVKLKAIFS